MRRRSLAGALAGGLILILGGTGTVSAQVSHAGGSGGDLRITDFGVHHTSTVPANQGRDVQLAVREVVQGAPPSDGSRPAVLFVHGASVSGIAAFDFDFQDYSWARFLARNGFDVFIMQFTGYGFSPRPEMSDPCNAGRELQKALLVPNPLDGPCPPSYPHALATSASDRSEIDAVVDWIRQRRGVAKVDLVGWSLGGMRAGTYTSLHPEKVDRLMLYAACCYRPDSPSEPPGIVPADGVPLNLQSWDRLVNNRWLAGSCSDNVDPGAPQAAWNQSMGLDPLGATWGSPEWNPISSPHGGVMRYPSWTLWGWNLDAAQRVSVPTLVIVGKKDGLHDTGRAIYRDLGASSKVFLDVACTTHFAVWERSHVAFRKASLEWFRDGAIEGVKSGEMTADADGTIHRP